MQDINQLPPEKQLDFWLGEWDVSWQTWKLLWKIRYRRKAGAAS